MVIPDPVRALGSLHRAALLAAFGAIAPVPEQPLPPGPLLLLCFTNRCGSNYLAELLASTGACTEAGEVFNAPTVLEHAARLGLHSLSAYMAALPALVGGTGCLAAKVSPDQLVMLADAGILDGLAGRVTYVLLERADRLGQAISRVLASQTGRWTSAQPATLPAAALRYERAAITAELARIALGNAAFYALFAANGIVPVHATYEAMLADPAALLDEIGERAGLGRLTADMARITLARQADGTNEAWRRRYLAGD